MQKNTTEIRKNTIEKNKRKIWKILKIWKNTLKIQKILMRTLKKDPHLIMVKNRTNARKILRKSGKIKILKKIHEN